MKVLLAPDKFKGSLTAAQVVHHLGRGLRARGVQISALPLADGGDGSVQAAVAAGFAAVAVTVAGATGEQHPTEFAIAGDTAVVEVANTCGLQTLPGGELAALGATSLGFGQAVRAVVESGCRRIVLALGGSASTDGGLGLLVALGARITDRSGAGIDALGGGSLGEIARVDLSGLVDLAGIELIVASDVGNPLTGPDGAAAVYGPQKGATAADVAALDAGLAHLVDVLAASRPDAADLARSAGAGAAGGIGFGCLLLGGRMVSGAEYFLDLLDFDNRVRDCDLVVTGEGRMDDQTLAGKLPAVVARRSAPRPVVAVVGRSDITGDAARRMGLSAIYALTDRTRGNPAGDPALSARLLTDIGGSLDLDIVDQAPPAVSG